jgi:hypothetical protein
VFEGRGSGRGTAIQLRVMVMRHKIMPQEY